MRCMSQAMRTLPLLAVVNSMCYALLHKRCFASALDPTSLLGTCAPAARRPAGCLLRQGPRRIEMPEPGAHACFMQWGQDKP